MTTPVDVLIIGAGASGAAAAWSSPGTGAVDYSAEDDAAAAVEQFAGPNFRTQVRECTPARAVEMSASLAPPSMKMRFRNAGFCHLGRYAAPVRRISTISGSPRAMARADFVVKAGVPVPRRQSSAPAAVRIRTTSVRPPITASIRAL